VTDEKRRTERRRVLKGGLIVFNNLRSTVNCTLRNISDTGALLRVESDLGIPETFELRYEGRTLACRVTRRTSKEIAVAFVA
jgi:hypothetical protein